MDGYQHVISIVKHLKVVDLRYLNSNHLFYSVCVCVWCTCICLCVEGMNSIAEMRCMVIWGVGGGGVACDLCLCIFVCICHLCVFMGDAVCVHVCVCMMWCSMTCVMLS